MEVEVFEERQAQFFSGKDPANCYRAAFPHCCGPGAESGTEQLEQAVAAYQQALKCSTAIPPQPTSQSLGRVWPGPRSCVLRAIGYKHALNNAATSRAEIIGPGNGSLPPSQRTVQKWFNTAAFTAPPPLEWGDAARNSLQGPATKELDLSLFKNFRFHALPSRRCGRATSPVPVQSTGGQQRAAVG